MDQQYKEFLKTKGRTDATFKTHMSLLKKAGMTESLWTMTAPELDALAKVGVVAKTLKEMLEQSSPQEKSVVSQLDLVEWGKTQQDLVHVFDVLWLVEKGWTLEDATGCPVTHPELCNRLIPTDVPEGLKAHVETLTRAKS
jgi:hypothetical protein